MIFLVAPLLVFEDLVSVPALFPDAMPRGPTKDSGNDNKPIKNEREKLIVAKVARNMPRRRSEKHLKRRRC